MQTRLYDRGQQTAISDNVGRVCNFLYQLSGDNFFGDVNLKFQNGEVVLVVKQESFKPNFLVVVEQHKVI